MGTTHPDASLERRTRDPMRWEPAAYFLPRGQTIQGVDAGSLGRCAKRGLKEVQDQEVPLVEGAFGRQNTLQAVQLAMGGAPVPDRHAQAALELLSGAPKRDAADLAAFLAHGRAVRILPEDYREPFTPG